MSKHDPKTASLPHANHEESITKVSAVVAVGLGEILWDMLPDGKQLGGAPANFAHACNALGAHGAIFSRVGDDALGNATRARLAREHINCNALTVDHDHPTGTVTVAVDNDGDPTYTFPDNVAWDFLTLPENAQRLAHKADIVCFGTLAQRSEQSRETIHKFIEMVPPTTLKVFDVNIRQQFYTDEIVRHSLAVADVLKLNAQELQVVAKATGLHAKTETALLQSLIYNYALKAVALTKGTTGSLVVTPEKVSEVTSFRVQVEDTVGAGDSFTAAFALGFHQKWDLDKTHRKAAIVASYVCTQAGAMPQLPDGLLMINKDEPAEEWQGTCLHSPETSSPDE